MKITQSTENPNKVKLEVEFTMKELQDFQVKLLHNQSTREMFNELINKALRQYLNNPQYGRTGM